MSEHPVSKKHRRPRRSRAEVAQIASSYPQSGLSQSQFCRQYGHSLSTLNKYCQHARHRDALPSASMSNSLIAVDLPLARAEFVEKPTMHTGQHDPLLVELAGESHCSICWLRRRNTGVADRPARAGVARCLVLARRRTFSSRPAQPICASVLTVSMLSCCWQVAAKPSKRPGRSLTTTWRES